MKKTFTLLALGLITINSYAQRTIDLEVSEILEPTQLNTEINGQQVTTGFPLTFVVRNNGTDSVLIGDTILWNTWIRDKASSQIIVQAPNGATTGNAYQALVSKNLAPTDTMHIKITANINLGLTLSRDVQVVVNAAVRNRSNFISPEQSATQANNQKIKEIVWYNMQGWNVSIDDVSFNNNLHVFPTLADDVVNVSVLYSSLTKVKIELYDLQGKLVMTESNSASFENNTFQVNTSALPEGTYIIKVNTGESVNTAKVQIRH